MAGTITQIDMTSEVTGVALITGAASGIGRSVAIKLAQDGFDIGLFDLKQSGEALDAVRDTIVNTTGRRTVSYLGDVSVEEDVKGFIDLVTRELGGVDVVSAFACRMSVSPTHNMCMTAVHIQMIANAGTAYLETFEDGLCVLLCLGVSE